jgi:hypothetical protein
MQTRKNDAAMPYNSEQDDGSFISEPGLTKREFFAAAALQGILANDSLVHFSAAELAVKKADELIKALNEIKPMLEEIKIRGSGR